ncbi:MAG: Ku protein [Actinomycetia bacterium]|nr:Ku protein [Actinomycetes bacterium]
MARSIWSGSVSFGLVNIPVKLFAAVRQHDVRFHQLAPDGSRVQYKRVSEKSGREVEYDKIRRGFETGRGKFVVFEPGELDELRPEATKTIDIEDFVALEQIDPIYYEHTYYLAPDGPAATKGYALLAAVMKDRERVAIGKIVMRDKQYLAAIRPYLSGLALSTMLFADEIVDPAEGGVFPERKIPVRAREKQLAAQIVDSLSRDWDPRRYHDDYEEQLRDVIKAKSKGKTIEPAEQKKPAEVVDLMEALRASLEKPRGGAAKRSGSGSGTRGRSARRATKRSAPRGRTKRTA